MMQRGTTDPEGKYHAKGHEARRVQAEESVYSGTPGTPFAIFLHASRAYAREWNDKQAGKV